MSRIGKTPVLIPEKVTVDFDGLTVTVKGPKGELKRLMPEGVSFDKKDNTVVVSPTTTKIQSRQRHGLCRALIANMIEGVSQGFSKKLEIVGVGSRAQVKGKNLVVSAGYSHPVEMIPPDGITYKLRVIQTLPYLELIRKLLAMKQQKSDQLDLQSHIKEKELNTMMREFSEKLVNLAKNNSN